MKKIVIATDSWAPLVNGVVTTLSEMVRRLELQGIEVVVIEPSKFSTIPCPGYPEIRLAYDINLPEQHLLQADAIHIATEGPIGLAVRNWCQKNYRRYNTSYHTNFPDYFWKYWNIPKAVTYPAIRWFHRDSDQVLVPTKTTQEKLQKKGVRRTKVWGRGYDETIFHPNYANLFAQDKLNLLCVSRISPEKNLETFFELGKNPDYRIFMVGDGPLCSRFQAKYPYVNFTGMLRGSVLASYYASADVFVFPSKSDTLGVVMIESLACGTPVVAYDVEGPKDVITTGGILTTNLEKAILDAKNIEKSKILQNAQLHTWDKSFNTFFHSLKFQTY